MARSSPPTTLTVKTAPRIAERVVTVSVLFSAANSPITTTTASKLAFCLCASSPSAPTIVAVTVRSVSLLPVRIKTLPLNVKFVCAKAKLNVSPPDKVMLPMVMFASEVIGVKFALSKPMRTGGLSKNAMVTNAVALCEYVSPLFALSFAISCAVKIVADSANNAPLSFAV